MNDDDLVSRDRAAQFLKRDTRTIKAALGDTPPDRAEPGKPKRWKIGTIRAALERHAVVNADYIRGNGTASSTVSLTSSSWR